MNNDPKNNILMLENIIQKRLTILAYFDAYLSPLSTILGDKYMHRNIPGLLVFFAWYFPA